MATHTITVSVANATYTGPTTASTDEWVTGYLVANTGFVFDVSRSPTVEGANDFLAFSDDGKQIEVTMQPYATTYNVVLISGQAYGVGALTWDDPSKRFFEAGVSNAAIYLKDVGADTYSQGYAWSGIASIDEQNEQDDAEPLYDHGMPYFYSNGNSRKELVLNCYTYPDALKPCLGFEQNGSVPMFVPSNVKRRFGLVYKTLVGNDTDGTDHGYKIHVFYNCLIQPTDELQSATITDEIEPLAMNFSIYPAAFKMTVNGVNRHVTHLEFDSREFEGNTTYKLSRLVNCLFGYKNGAPVLPSPSDIISVLSNSYYDL